MIWHGGHAAVPAGLLGAASLAIFDRLKGLIKGPPTTVTEVAPSAVRSLSDRSTGESRATPPDPKRMDQIAAAGRKLSAAQQLTDLEPLLLPSLEEVCDALDAERATIFVVRPGVNDLMSYVGMGLEPNHPIVLPTLQGIAGETFRAATVVVCNAPDSDRRHFQLVDEALGFKTLNLLAAPLKDPVGGVFGVLEILNKLGGFTSSDQAIVMPYVSALADALYPHLKSLQ